jgi:hypothetical protein
MLCTGCERHWYGEDAGPCPNCFPADPRQERQAALEAFEEIILDFFAFEAAVRI